MASTVGSLLPKVLRLLMPLVMIISQSPFTHLSTGVGISPLQVMAKYLQNELNTKKAPVNPWLVKSCKTLLFPGNVLRTPDPRSANHTEVWERGLEMSTRRMDAYASIKHPEVLMAGSWCIVLGTFISLLLRRVHMVIIFGFALFGASLYMNSLAPTLQFGLCVLSAFSELQKAAAIRREQAEQNIARADAVLASDKKGAEATEGAARKSGKASKKSKGE